MGATGPTGATGSTECFTADTRLATPSGERAIADLTVGDLVRTADGGVVAIRWIGRRTLNPERQPDPEKVRPVRIVAGAFGDHCPMRDLRVSPGHGIFVRHDGGEHLIPAGCLVNGVSVIQERVESVDYMHLEFDRHEIVLAEGLPAESYLDVGSRAEFETADGLVVLHPVFAPLSHEAARAPFVVAGPVLDAVRAKLSARAMVMPASAPLRRRRTG